MSNRTFSPSSLSATAGSRAKRAKRMLEAASGELNAASASLATADEEPDPAAMAQAHERARSAEREVREAAQELEIATELVKAEEPETAAPADRQVIKRSGEGLRSVLPHLRNHDG